jgi:hypothetical protein
MTAPQVNVPTVVYTKAKAVVATLTTGLGVVTLFVTQIADGVLTWPEGGALIGAIGTAIATVGAVWRVPNGEVR